MLASLSQLGRNELVMSVPLTNLTDPAAGRLQVSQLLLLTVSKGQRRRHHHHHVDGFFPAGLS
jgi:hypothetical protein